MQRRRTTVHPRVPRCVAAASHLLWVLASCSSGDVQEARPTEAAGGVSRSDLAFILESGVSPANPSGAVVGQCMRSKGFSWIDPVPASTSGEASPGQDEAFVAKFGYGILSGPTDPAEPDPNLALFNALSDGQQAAYNVALVGNEDGLPPIAPSSCLGREQQALVRSTAMLQLEGVQRAMAELAARVDSDDEVVAARAAWSQCISSAGYAAATRDALMEDFRRLAEVPMSDAQRSQAVQREIATASADLRCSAAIEAAVSAARRRVTPSILDTYSR